MTITLLPAFTQTKHADLSAFENKVFNADALDLLASLPDASVDMVLCDLPYGVTACVWDTVIPLAPMWEQLKRLVKQRAAIVLTATQPFTSRLVSSNYEMFKYSWVWDKVNASTGLHALIMPIRAHEDICVFGFSSPRYYPIMKAVELRQDSKRAIPNGDAFAGKVADRIYSNDGFQYPKSILKISNANQLVKSGHPTEKPVALFEYLIRTYTQENEIVLDMTCGSGTTGVAAANLNRRYICGDNGRDDRTGRWWADIARQRIQNADPMQATIFADGSKQLSLFTETA